MTHTIDRAAVLDDALHAACLAIQTALGVPSGDTAAQYWDEAHTARFVALLGPYFDAEVENPGAVFVGGAL